MSAQRLAFAAHLVLAALVLHLFLIQPNHPAAMTWGALTLFPLELPVILFGLAALGAGSISVVVRIVLVAALVIISVLKVADFAMFSALSRGFNPVADPVLIVAGLRLIAGSVGALAALGAFLGALVAIGVFAWVLWWATGVWTRVPVSVPWRRLTAVAAIAAAAVSVAEIGQALGRWSLPLRPPGAAFTARMWVERIETSIATIADLRSFRIAAANDPFAERDGLLDLIDRDVIVVFVESYGRTSFDTEFYAQVHRPTLEAAEARLAAMGLAMRSGFLSAPTRGGQSWLSHSTFANGLWIDGQTRYAAILASGRQTLYHMARRAGFRTAAVMPAITLDWPESAVMGFDTVLAAKDLGYKGAPFNWVTMPDQFTLAALDRLLRTGQHALPLFAQVVLISSHAPWVPVPSLVPWEDLGDGRIFDDVATSGDPPEVVWRDTDRVRYQYRLAIDYSLSAVFDYAALHSEDPPLILVIGDHQAAGFIALDDRRDVPVHLIGPASLVDVARNWGWIEGLIPDPAAPVRSMDTFRDLILQDFSTRRVAAGTQR